MALGTTTSGPWGWIFGTEAAAKLLTGGTPTKVLAELNACAHVSLLILA